MHHRLPGDGVEPTRKSVRLPGKGVGDLLVEVGDVRAEDGEDRDHDDRDQRDQERVLEYVLAFFVPEEARPLFHDRSWYEIPQNQSTPSVRWVSRTGTVAETGPSALLPTSTPRRTRATIGPHGG